MVEHFKDKSKRNKAPASRSAAPPQFVTRVRTPRDNEVIGVVEQRVGANRMIVKCFDDNERNCRIPGALRRTLWIRPGDFVIVKPWEFEGDKKGDILFKYTPAAVEFLKNRGFIKEVASEF